MRGFFIQDPNPDSDPLTSEGVFVFVPPASPFFSLALSAGDTVHLRGRVTEFQNQTEIDTLDQLVVCGTGTDIAATPVTLPETTNGDLERYEGMKITLSQTMTVEQNFFQGRFGQLSLGYGGRLYQPTNQFRAGTPEAQALADLNHRSTLVLDDATTAQNPNPVPYLPADGISRAGDTVSGIEGILDEGPINSDTTIRDYRVQPTKPPTFSQDNRRTTAPPAVGGNLKVAFFNVLNYFTTLDDANAPPPPALEPRGANTAAEFDRQRAKIFAAMSAIDADVFGLSEIENLPGTHAVQNLVDGLNQYVERPGPLRRRRGPSNGHRHRRHQGGADLQAREGRDGGRLPQRPRPGEQPAADRADLRGLVDQRHLDRVGARARCRVGHGGVAARVAPRTFVESVDEVLHRVMPAL